MLSILLVYIYIYRDSVSVESTRGGSLTLAPITGQIGNRFIPAESAFSACIRSGSSQTSTRYILDTIFIFYFFFYPYIESTMDYYAYNAGNAGKNFMIIQ